MLARSPRSPRGAWLLLISATSFGLALGAACDGGQTTVATSGTAGSNAGGSGGSGGDGTGGLNVGGAPGCVDGEACEGGICAGGECCESERACVSECCAEGDICSFQECVTPGDECIDADDCTSDEYCEYALGEPTGQGGGGASCQGGIELPTGKCLPKPPRCGEDEDPGDPPTCLEACEYVPPTPAFDPQLKYSWGMELAPPYATDIMMTPIVLQLDDDNCDGVINERDIPDIVFSTFQNGQYNGAGVLRAISVQSGVLVEKWFLPDVIQPTRQLAGGNIDGVPGSEIVACASDGTVKALSGAGVVLWTSPPLACVMPSIADLDQDGDVEVIVEGAILDGVTGTIEHNFSEPLDSSFVVSDITGDGKLEIVTGSQAFDDQGQLIVDTNLANTSSFAGTSDWKSPWPAVADLDGDGTPEIVVVHNLEHELSIWRYDPTAPNDFVVVRGPIDINGTLPATDCPSGSWGRTHGGGPPTIADFNGDGVPDVALAGGVGYAVFDGAKLMDPLVAGPDTFLWVRSTTDCSSASTGSTVFDFNGDGIAEVIYSDQLMLRVYEGPTGNVLWDTCNTTATLIENPIVADIDNDGHADIVAVSNAYSQTCDDGTTTKQAGVRVFSDTTWVRTRRIWNEHAYHITNVEEDGTIPQLETVNYLEPGLNNFRLNKQPGGEFSAPDAVVSVAPRCAAEFGLEATVRNVGEASLPADVVVGFYAGLPPSGTLLGTASTTRVLYALDSEKVFLALPSPDPDIVNGNTFVYAVVDDGPPHPEWNECRTDNNTSVAVSAACAIVN